MLFDRFEEKKKVLDNVRFRAEWGPNGSQDVMAAQQNLEHQISHMRKFFTKKIEPLQKRFNIKLPGAELLEDATGRLNRRIVPPSCRVGAFLPILYQDPERKYTLTDLFYDKNNI